ncbi:lysine N(6)-hydroxylase/L-ornithine N(5)-oxygenase family protein [Salinifilum ghardaiensis]
MGGGDGEHPGEGDYDVLGVGFGPSNLALAIAIEEHNRSTARAPLSGLFLERQEDFGWHRGMLIDGTTLQVSFLKDLVTPRDPASDFSFLCYLRERGRLADFINHKTLFPTRVEYHDYLEWAASRMAHRVRYGSEVVSVAPVRDGQRITRFAVTTRSADGYRTYRARNLVLGLGLEAAMPRGVVESGRVWHNLDLLQRVEQLGEPSPRRFTVVGAGQSAAEAVEYLHRAFPGAEVCAVFRRYGYSPSDDSPFANRIFDPQAVQDFYAAPEGVKGMLAGYHANTNYSVVDLGLIEELYRRHYQEKVTGEHRLRVHHASELRGVEEHAGGVRAEVEFLPTGERQVLDSDVLVCATGCSPRDPFALLGEVGPHCLRDELGRPSVGRDYRLRTTDDLEAGIYLQGGTEHAHGITSSLLSNGAVRAGEIRDALLSSRAVTGRARARAGAR